MNAENIIIVNYNASYHQAFRSLNLEWISKYFEMEESDFKSLDHPDEYILQKGGEILVALSGDQPIGVCALIKMDNPDFDYELAKMAVSPAFRGKRIGYLLGKAIEERARALGAKNIYLESNTVLEPAIRLYRKLGFQEIKGYPSPYARCNIQMAKTLE